MKTSWVFVVSTGVSIALSCTPARDRQEPPKAELSRYVLEKAPAVEQRHFIDFGGKVHLLGYELSPAGLASPGTELKLTFYWRCLGDLEEGWGLFTHLFDERGRRVGNYDNEGPLRALEGSHQALPPGAWEPGKYYVDEQSITIPKELASSSVTIVTGVWMGGMRLPVVSGLTDGDNAGIVVHLKTGVEPPKPALERAEN